MESSEDLKQVPLVNTEMSKRRNTLSFGQFEVSIGVANIFFAFLAIVGQVGQSVTLPLWIDSTKSPSSSGHSTSSNHTNVTVLYSEDHAYFSAGNNYTYQPYQPNVDGYFVLTFASASFVVIFGIALLCIRLFQPYRLGETERRFPTSQLFQVGFCNALNGVLIIFACSGTRTAPYLQTIIGNFMIPLTIALRYVILHKVPTLRKFICAMIVLVSLFVCLTPKIFTSIDPHVKSYGGASGIAGVLWPLCYMFGFLPGALMNVLMERGLKTELASSSSRVNLVFFLFWTSVFQLLTALCLFWVDFVPVFGYADNIYHFWDNWLFGFKCFFGGAGCSSKCGVRGAVYISMYTISYIGGGNLIKYSEGATLLSIANALVTPLVFLFWTLFRELPFGFRPAVHITTWFSIASLVPMIPAIYMYNSGPDEKDKSAVEPSEGTSLLLHEDEKSRYT